MKTKLLLLLVILLLIAAGCRSQSVPEATDAFCQSLVAYGESLKALEDISPTSTVGELKDAQKAEQAARKDVEKAASYLREAKLDAISQAWKNLDKTVNQVSNKDTLAEVAEQVRQDMAAIRAAYEQLGLGNCPELFPAAAEGPAGRDVTQPGQPITGTQTISGTQPISGTRPITGTEAMTGTLEATAPVTTTEATTSTAAPAAPETAAETLAAAPAGPFGTWQLQGIQSTSTGATITPNDPALYTLTVAPDGSATVLADCVSGSGTYSVAGDTVNFNIQYNGVSCPPPSITSQYIKYLDYATTYELSDGTLVIWYSYGAGKMTFAQAAQ